MDPLERENSPRTECGVCFTSPDPNGHEARRILSFQAGPAACAGQKWSNCGRDPCTKLVVAPSLSRTSSRALDRAVAPLVGPLVQVILARALTCTIAPLSRAVEPAESCLNQPSPDASLRMLKRPSTGPSTSQMPLGWGVRAWLFELTNPVYRSACIVVPPASALLCAPANASESLGRAVA